MRRVTRAGAALAVLIGTLVPAGMAGASVRTPGVRIGPTTYSSASPQCSYSFDTWPEAVGNEVTALHVIGTWSCPGLNPYETYGSIDLEDMTMTPQGTVSTWPVGSASQGVAGGSGSVSDVYSYPKTAHTYQATFQLDFIGLDPANLQSTPDCSTQPSNSSTAYVCVFTQQYVVQMAPPVASPAPAPVHQSLTLATTDGHSCEFDLDLAAAGPGQVSYEGSVPPTTCDMLGPPRLNSPLGELNWAQTFAYANQREPGPPVASGNFQCWYCSNTSSSGGILPAIANYTVTYYVGIELGSLTLASVPAGCSPGQLNWLYCELNASVRTS